MKVNVGAISDTGRVREANEDSFLVDTDLFVFAVADGMGGHVAGEIASATAIETLRADIAQGIGVDASIENAHSALKNKAKMQQELSGMGTTLTAIGFTSSKKLAVAHVGDSRAYVLHRELENENAIDTSSELVRITKDHSLVEELVDAGEITEDEANVHPRRSVITRALGIDGSVEVDIYPIDFLKGDRYLLCSDGLTSMVRDQDILEILKTEKTPDECARTLVSKANQAGGNDNITVMIIDVIDPEVKAPALPTQMTEKPASENEKSEIYKKGRTGFLLRIAISFLLVGALLAGAFFTAKRFATQGYFLDQKNGEVVLMSGKHGGVLWWDPKVNSETGIEVDNLTAGDKLLVVRHESYGTREEALKRLESIHKRQINNDDRDSSSQQTTTSQSSTTQNSNTPQITITNGTSVSVQD